MAKTVCLLVAAVAIGLIAFLSLRGEELLSIPHLVPPQLNPLAQSTHSAPHSVDAAGDPVQLTPGETPAPTASEPKFSSDPSTRPTPRGKILQGKEPISEQKQREYIDALNELQIAGCNANGSFTVQIHRQAAPHTLRPGEPIEFTSGLVLTGRVSSYPECRVTLFDHDQRVAELSSF